MRRKKWRNKSQETGNDKKVERYNEGKRGNDKMGRECDASWEKGRRERVT